MKGFNGVIQGLKLAISAGLVVAGIVSSPAQASGRVGVRDSKAARIQGRRVVAPREAMPDRFRATELRAEVLAQASFDIELFGGERVWVDRDQVVQLPDGDRVWSGKVRGEPLSRVTFASRRGVVSGVLDRAMTTGNELYEIEPDGAGGQVLFQHAEARIAASGETLEVEGGGGGRRAMPAAGAADAVVRVIDVMMLYTPASRVRYGQAGIEAKILQAVADANSAMGNSLIPVRFSLVYLGEVPYVETGSMTAALMALQRTSDGILDEVHGLRDQYGADLTTLVDEDTSSCGLSYLMSTPSRAFEANAFSVVYSGCLASLSLVHEWGHNLGCQHDRTNSGGPAAYPFAYGWRQCSTNQAMFRTVMAYACGSAIRINYFSNPRLSYAGLPLGVDEAVDPVNAADNARAITLSSAFAVDFRPSADGILPLVPGGLVLQSASHLEVGLAWVDNSPNEVVQALERSANGVEWSLVAVLGKDVTTYVDRAVTEGQQWYYRVSAVNGAGASEPTAALSVLVPLKPVVPLSPEGVVATCANGSATVAWLDRSTNETSYRLERCVNGGSFVPWAVLAQDTTSFRDTTVSAGNTYSYRLIASNAAGDSAPSAPGSVMIPVVAPVAPSALVGKAISGSQISLTWTDNSTNETGFRIERSTNGSTWTAVGTVGANGRTYTATGLKSLTTYYFRVQAYNTAGASAYTTRVTVKTLR